MGKIYGQKIWAKDMGKNRAIKFLRFWVKKPRQSETVSNKKVATEACRVACVQVSLVDVPFFFASEARN